MGFEPAECIVVEDGVPGVEAGCRAGMGVLGYGPAGRSERLADAGAEVLKLAGAVEVDPCELIREMRWENATDSRPGRFVLD